MLYMLSLCIFVECFFFLFFFLLYFCSLRSTLLSRERRFVPVANYTLSKQILDFRCLSWKSHYSCFEAESGSGHQPKTQTRKFTHITTASVGIERSIPGRNKYVRGEHRWQRSTRTSARVFPTKTRSFLTKHWGTYQTFEVTHSSGNVEFSDSVRWQERQKQWIM